MSSTSGPLHVVVDGSNIATEGRSMPSLTQLNEAVMAFMEEHPDALVTVVVDATFGHRIPKSESDEFEAGISNNELVAPPAGAVGRGDAFVLGIADKAGAAVLSNDSFQEFHGEYEWLFDEGRLIGGKPVPHVGWVFVERVPVRGPVSRKATRSTKGSGQSSKTSSAKRSRSGGTRRSGKASKAASEPMPVPTEPPPGRGAPSPEPAAQPDATSDAMAEATSDSSGSPGRRRAPRANEPVNDLLPFLEFVEHHPVGTSVNGTVDAYSSHGAYVTIGDQGVRAYVPLRLMADPPPRSARKVMKTGESVTLVVVSFAPERRSIDCAVPDMAEREIADVAEASSDPELVARATSDAAGEGKRTRKKAARKRKSAAGGTTPERAAAEEPEAGEGAAKPAAAEKKTATKRTATKKTAAKRSGTKKAAAKRSATKKTATKRTATKKTAAKKAAAKKTAAKKTAAKKAAAKKSAAKKAASTGSAAEATSTEHQGAEQSAAGKAASRKTGAKRSGAKKSASRKTAAKRSAKRTATRSAPGSGSTAPIGEGPADDGVATGSSTADARGAGDG